MEPNQEYIDSISIKYNTNNLDELAKAELIELEKTGIVGKFINYKVITQN